MPKDDQLAFSLPSSSEMILVTHF